MTREEAANIITKYILDIWMADGISIKDVPNFKIALDMAIKTLQQQPCDDAISRQAVFELVADYDLSMGQIVKGIHSLPPVSPMPKMGRWEKHDVRGQRVDCCSVCGLSNGTIYEYNYCPNCGAKMEDAE